MNTKTAIKRATKVVQLATNYSNPRKINGRSKSYFVRAIAQELFISSKKWFYIGFGAGLLVAIITFLTISNLKIVM